MNLSVSALAIQMLARPATLLRAGAGTYVDHEWVDGAETAISIRAVIQSPTQADMRVLPEGERTDGYVTIWTETELRTVDEDDATNADVILTPEGVRYRVLRNGARREGGFWRVIGRLDRDGGRSR